jgi:N-methylhydantoinase A
VFIGVDIGGTFTDLALIAGGRVHIHKLFSTPTDPAAAMLDGLRALSATQPGSIDALRGVAHGSTVATNALIERRGAKTALLMTAGFRDVLFIGRQHRPDLYALQPTLPPPLIPREWCFDIPERLDYTGEVITPLDLDALNAVIDQLQAAGVEAVAICYLYSFVNPRHERITRDQILRRGWLTEAQIACSHEVLPQFREYERASATAIEAFIRPVMGPYISRLESGLGGVGLRIMRSDGAVMTARTARTQAIQTVLSGPAAGVAGAFFVAKQAGYDQIITLDMGGTSTDVALCPGKPTFTPERLIDGLPLRVTALDIETIGAGGGSIAQLDSGGALQVGPHSAGAVPGSIIYGRGGTQVTVSDANAVLGRLDPAHFLGGAAALDLESARAALAALGAQIGRDARGAAAGVIDVANANIEGAVRRVSVARGHDPRGFTLVAFGGAGPLHACAVAERLEMPRVLIPPHPGVMCAFGLLVADVGLEISRSVLGVLTAERTPQHAKLVGATLELAYESVEMLRREGFDPAASQAVVQVDMRYAGQAYELSIPYTPDVGALLAAFHAAHHAEFGFNLPHRPVETVNVRYRAAIPVPAPELAAQPEQPNDGANARIGERGGLTHYERTALIAGAAFSGPALILQPDSTTYVPEGWHVRADGWGNLILER